MSKPLSVSIPHALGKAEARRRIEQGFERFGQQFGGLAEQMKQTWTGDRLSFSLSAMGQPISGSLDVLDDAVRIDVVLPGLLGMVAGKIKSRMQKEGQILLEKK